MDKYDVLKSYFKYDSFRGNQEEIIDSLLDGRNVIAILKTGGGKSICFQIPSLLSCGITIVVTPLISLMYDQVLELKKRGIRAAYLNSSQSHKDMSLVYNSLDSIKILYVSPERLLSDVFLEKIKGVKISYLIVDEAHTILWHMDFRESFLGIKSFLKSFKYKITVGMFSATANLYTINEIKRVVGIYDFKIIKSEFDRSELFYRVVRNENKLEYIIKYLDTHTSTGIIYAQTRKDVMMMYEYLKDKYKVSYYHGGLSNEVKEKNQKYFMEHSNVIMISTVSFGMGINKPDIRFVINYNIPDSLESLSQMIGRCSRDGKYGEAIVLYNDIDKRVLNFFIREIDATNKSIKEINNVKKYKYVCLNSMIKALSGRECLHKSISRYFGEEIDQCKDMCSVCTSRISK